MTATKQTQTAKRGTGVISRGVGFAPHLDKLLRQQAKSRGCSLSVLVNELVAKALKVAA